MMSFAGSDLFKKIKSRKRTWGSLQIALEGQNEQLNLQIRDKALELVQHMKYLGVHLDNWKKHIQER